MNALKCLLQLPAEFVIKGFSIFTIFSHAAYMILVRWRCRIGKLFELKQDYKNL